MINIRNEFFEIPVDGEEDCSGSSYEVLRNMQGFYLFCSKPLIIKGFKSTRKLGLLSSAHILYIPTKDQTKLSYCGEAVRTTS